MALLVVVGQDVMTSSSLIHPLKSGVAPGVFLSGDALFQVKVVL